MSAETRRRLTLGQLRAFWVVLSIVAIAATWTKNSDSVGLVVTETLLWLWPLMLVRRNVPARQTGLIPLTVVVACAVLVSTLIPVRTGGLMGLVVFGCFIASFTPHKRMVLKDMKTAEAPDTSTLTSWEARYGRVADVRRFMPSFLFPQMTARDATAPEQGQTDPEKEQHDQQQRGLPNPLPTPEGEPWQPRGYDDWIDDRRERRADDPYGEHPEV